MRRIIWLLVAMVAIIVAGCTFGSDRTQHFITLFPSSSPNDTVQIYPSNKADFTFPVKAADSLFGSLQAVDSELVDFFAFNSQVYHNGPYDSAHAMAARTAISGTAFGFTVPYDDTVAFRLVNRENTLRRVVLNIKRSYWTRN